MENLKILLVEDEQQLGEIQRDFLVQQGMAVLWLKDGREIEQHLAEFEPHVIVLDLMLPGASGFDICRKIRNIYPGIILFLTSSDDDIDHVASLELGADDFVTKPIRPRVLLARIRMLLRSRSPEKSLATNTSQEQLSFGSLTLKKLSREVTLAGEPIHLTGSEFNLLWLLASNPDQVMERNYLFKELRGIEFDGIDRSVDTKIVSLRKKLSDADDASKRIVTIRNRGYLFCSDGWES